MRAIALFFVYLAAVTFGTYQAFGPMLDSRFARMPADRGDGMLNHFILEHTWQCVSNPSYRWSLSSPPVFYPEPHTLWYSEHMLGIAPTYWALRSMLPDDLAYQWWQILTNALNFVAFAAVLRWLRQPHAVAILGGYLWAFALVHIEQIKHQQMIPRFWVPLAAYHAWAFSLTPSTRHLNRMAVCTFIQSITCVYTGWFLTVGLLVFLPTAILLRAGGWRDALQFGKENRWRVFLIVGGWGVAMAVAFVPYIVVNWGIKRTYDECKHMIPTPSAWLTGPPGSRWEQTTSPFRAPVSGECQLFCGFGLYLLMLASALSLPILRRRNRPPEFAPIAAGLLTAAVWALLTFTPEAGGQSLWEVVRVVPGAMAIRVVSRVYIIVFAFGTLAALVWLGTVTAQLRPWMRASVLSLIAVAIVFEQTGCDPPTFAKHDFYAIVDRTAGQLRGAEVGYVVPRYTDTQGEMLDWVYGEVFAMWVGLRAGVPVVNGYSGRTPPGNHPSLFIANDEQIRAWLTRKSRGKLTIVDPDHAEATRVIAIE